MKYIEYIIAVLIALALILFAGYAAIDEKLMPAAKTKAKAPIALQKFEVTQEPAGFSALTGMVRKTTDSRKRNLRYAEIDEEVDRCIKKITKNWKRTHARSSGEWLLNEVTKADSGKEEWIMSNQFDEIEKPFYGYDEEEDFNLRWRLRNRAIDGKKVC